MHHIHIQIYIYIHTHIHIYTYTHIHIYTYTHIHTHIHIYTYAGHMNAVCSCIEKANATPQEHYMCACVEKAKATPPKRNLSIKSLLPALQCLTFLVDTKYGGNKLAAPEVGRVVCECTSPSDEDTSVLCARLSCIYSVRQKIDHCHAEHTGVEHLRNKIRSVQIGSPLGSSKLG
jgi:hypothetical protein